jgi:hypothetical protein
MKDVLLPVVIADDHETYRRGFVTVKRTLTAICTV